jgi:hypothetical protein
VIICYQTMLVDCGDKLVAVFDDISAIEELFEAIEIARGGNSDCGALRGSQFAEYHFLCKRRNIPRFVVVEKRRGRFSMGTPPERPRRISDTVFLTPFLNKNITRKNQNVHE